MPSDAKGRAFAALRFRLPNTVQLWRIENAAGPGLPDVYGVGAGISFWVELKVGRRLRNGSIRVPSKKLLLSQYATLIKLYRAGVPVYIAVYVARRLFVAKFSPEFWRMLGTSEGAMGLEAKMPGEKISLGANR